MSSNWPEKYQHHPPEKPADQSELDAIYKYSEFDFHPVDVDQAWDSLNSKISKKSFNYSIFWKVAAILLLTGGLTFTILQFDGPIPDDSLTEISTLKDTKAYRLPDGSLVTLASNSSLAYSEKGFSKNRDISFEGEAFFEIVKSNSTFTISTADAEVKVLGTSFNLETYKGVNLFVKTGLVSLETSKGSKEVSPGEFASAKKTGDIVIRKNTDPNLLSWKTGIFNFNHTKLQDAFQYLEKYYNVSFTANKELASCTITANFDKKSLEEVVDVLSTILNAKSQINGKEVNFKGSGCK